MQPHSPRRVIIHAGFHKTGTKTVQNVLKAHHQLLAPHVCVILKSDIRGLCTAALAYSQRPDTTRLHHFRNEAALCFGDMPADDARPILISAEDLAGAIPGRRKRIGYPHATALLSSLIAQMTPDCAPHIYLSTRAPAAWLKSCYAHNLRHARTRLSLDAFVAAHTGPRLDDIAAEIASTLDPVPVTTAALEETSGAAEGPLTPILDLLAFPDALRARLRPTTVSNPSLPPHILDELLELNRNEDDGARRNAAKKQFIADYMRRTQ
ncbi:hypothetical protein C7964_103323 [Loktanella sp. PT4BL]|jgi:hypothetical protein|uniref:hypothetical protein n=1 Tax=Loktanella sp. PT4BL TaxID=2135611 RepID=UPI000D769ACD|nr:hypothetical protein [Loktanella sp. PT4BL]PXW68815.1 hypothetical protein C7964_103323 [Loktanella sp. PT4BL]